jgi:hypothetical protein
MRIVPDLIDAPGDHIDGTATSGDNGQLVANSRRLALIRLVEQAQQRDTHRQAVLPAGNDHNLRSAEQRRGRT